MFYSKYYQKKTISFSEYYDLDIDKIVEYSYICSLKK